MRKEAPRPLGFFFLFPQPAPATICGTSHRDIEGLALRRSQPHGPLQALYPFVGLNTSCSSSTSRGDSSEKGRKNLSTIQYSFPRAKLFSGSLPYYLSNRRHGTSPCQL